MGNRGEWKSGDFLIDTFQVTNLKDRRGGSYGTRINKI